MLPKSAPGRLIAGICAVAMASAHGASFDYVAPSADEVDFNPSHVVMDAGGTWVTGNATARFRTDGSLAFAAPPPLSGDASLTETADGGVVEGLAPILGTPIAFPCMLFKLGPDAALQWTQTVSGGGYCASVTSANDGVIWTTVQLYSLGIQVFRINSDGSGLAQIGVASNLVPMSSLTPAGDETSDLYMAGYAGSGGATSPAFVLKLDQSGQVAWQWNDSAGGFLPTELASDTSGNVYAIGTDNSQASQPLVICSFTSAGAERWCQHQDVPGADDASGLAVLADGTSLVLTQSASDGRHVLAKIAADGSLAWQHDLPPQGIGSRLSRPDGHLGLRIAPNGDILALADSSAPGSPSTTNLSRYDAGGTLIGTSVVQGRAGADSVGVSAMIALPDSSALLTTYSNFSAAGFAVDGNGFSSGLFLHLDRSGQAVANPFAAASLADNGFVAGSLVDDDGTTYLLIQHALAQLNRPEDNIIGASSARYSLSKISPAGTKIWESAATDGLWWTARLSKNADRICIGGNRADYVLYTYSGSPPPGGAPDTRAECYAAATGAALWSTELRASDTYFSNPVILRVLADSRLAAAYEGAVGGYEVATLGADGSVAASHIIAAGQAAGIAPDGSTLFFDNETAPTLSVVRADGSTAYEEMPSVHSIAFAQYLDDGTAEFIAVAADGSLVAGAISSAGALQWSTPVADAATASSLQALSAQDNDHGDIFLALATGATSNRLMRIDRTSGAIVWQSAVLPASTDSGIAIDPASGKPVFYARYDHKIGLQAVDVSSGAVDAPRYEACGVADCAGLKLDRAQFGADATLRVVLTYASLTPQPATAPQVLGLDAVAQARTPIAAAQPGVVGAWYAPYETGQGFLVDYIAYANTLFIPWFTYTQAGGNDPSALAWYTLQGPVSPTATEAGLVIYRVDDGIFQRASGTTRTVGTAHARFFDCDHGTLDYQFDDDVNGGATGSINISRLSPSTSPCALANGSAVPPEIQNAANDGFDARQSGAWFDPTMAGQGIEFTVIPSGGGFAGLLFGAWFTFDPENASDDPANAHWFTLQGDLSSASNGAVTVPILVALGGTFDDAPTRNIVRVGQATITFDGCATATLDYRFDDTIAAHAYRNLTGRVNLTKFESCSN